MVDKFNERFASPTRSIPTLCISTLQRKKGKNHSKAGLVISRLLGGWAVLRKIIR